MNMFIEHLLSQLPVADLSDRRLVHIAVLVKEAITKIDDPQKRSVLSRMQEKLDAEALRRGLK